MIAVVNLVFAASADKTYGPGAALEVTYEGASDAFLGHALGFLFLRANLNHRRSKAPDSGFPCCLRVLVRIDVLYSYLGRQIRILVKQVSAIVESRTLVEIFDRRALL